jgi:predicted transcriptional regulator
MPQLQVIPAAPDFSSQIGAEIGAGFGRGLSSAVSQYLESAQQRREGTLVSEALRDIDPETANPYEVAAKIMQLPIRDESKRMYGTLAQLGFKATREHRLQSQGIHDQYRRAISDLNAEIKESPFSKDKNRLLMQRDKLKKELAQNHRFLREGKQPVFDVYESLGIEDMQEGQMPEQAGMGEAPKARIETPKPKVLAPQKPKRKLTEQVARHFLKQANNDIKEAKRLAFEQGFE